MVDIKYKMNWVPQAKELRDRLTAKENVGIASKIDEDTDDDFYQNMYEALSKYFSSDEDADKVLIPEETDRDAISTEVIKSYDDIMKYYGKTGMLSREAVDVELDKVLGDPRMLEIPTKTFDDTEEILSTEEVLSVEEVSDIASDAINSTSDADEVQPKDIPEGGLGSPPRKNLADLEPLGEGYEGYLERYTTVDNVDFEFIKELEGYKTDMYVPKIKGEVLEKSGATIASGFDLGQRNESDLEGLPKALIDKLKPYLGKKKKVADDFVKANPLTITEKEADIINAFAKKQELDRLIKSWNNSSDVKWEDLSEAKATTVASVSFQFGNLPIKTPKFWEYTTSGNWTDARDELRDFYGKDEKGLERQRIYGPRRNKEADYLEQDNLLGTKAY